MRRLDVDHSTLFEVVASQNLDIDNQGAIRDAALYYYVYCVGTLHYRHIVTSASSTYLQRFPHLFDPSLPRVPDYIHETWNTPSVPSAATRCT